MGAQRFYKGWIEEIKKFLGQLSPLIIETNEEGNEGQYERIYHKSRENGNAR